MANLSILSQPVSEGLQAAPSRRGSGLRRASERRRKPQGGQEFVEFGLVMSLLLVPMFLGSFVSGMNLLVTVQAKDVVRDAANLYIHGTDFSTYSAQQLAQRLAKGLNLQIGSSFSGNQQSNLSASGNAVIVLTELEYVGSTTSPNCVAVGASSCVNHDSFVFLQRVVFGSSTIYSTHPSTIGDYTGTGTNAIANNGAVPSPITNTYAKLSASAQSAMTAATTANANQTALSDGQVIYMVEGYFDTSGFSLGGLGNQWVYARYFF